MTTHAASSSGTSSTSTASRAALFDTPCHMYEIKPRFDQLQRPELVRRPGEPAPPDQPNALPSVHITFAHEPTL